MNRSITLHATPTGHFIYTEMYIYLYRYMNAKVDYFDEIITFVYKGILLAETPSKLLL